MHDDALSALASAWRVSLVASILLFAALAIAPVWDRDVYIKALHEALTMEPP